MKNFCSLVVLLSLLGGAVPAQAASRVPRSPDQIGRFDWSMARKLFKKLHPRSAVEVGSALKDAHARRDFRAIAENAAELCFLGDRTGLACEAAERFGGHLLRRAVFVKQ